MPLHIKKVPSESIEIRQVAIGLGLTDSVAVLLEFQDSGDEDDPNITITAPVDVIEPLEEFGDVLEWIASTLKEGEQVPVQSDTEENA